MTGNIKLAGFEIRKIDHKEMMIGLALIALSFLMPVLFTVQNFQSAGVYASCVGKAEDRSDGGCFTPGDVKCPCALLRIISEHRYIAESQWNSTGEGKKVGYPMHA